MEINRRFADIRNSTGLNRKQFADSLGISQSVAGDIELGKREPSREVMTRLATVYRVNLNWLLTGEGGQFIERGLDDALGQQGIGAAGPFVRKTQASASFKKLPVYSAQELTDVAFVVPLLNQKLSAGSGQELPEDDEISALIPVPPHLSKYGKDLAALTVDGDSMYPTLHRGDMVVCDSRGWDGEGIYAIHMNGEGFVKRISRATENGKVMIISDNPKYPPLEKSEDSQDFQIIGRVHCAIIKVE